MPLQNNFLKRLELYNGMEGNSYNGMEGNSQVLVMFAIAQIFSKTAFPQKLNKLVWVEEYE